ncbi:Arginine-glutamic acid dipeptide repeat protein [Hirschfeldia incana]|nr:Arginine-glutamic acid dipeptide repeat protein [Hirschfeldia incana]
MVLVMDEGKIDMEETGVMEESSDVEFACGDPKVEPRVGDEFQAEIPHVMSASKRAVFLSTPLALDDSSSSFLIGQPVQVMWIDKHQKGQVNGDDDNIDMNQSLKSLRAKRSRSSAKTRGGSVKKQRLNLEAVPEIPTSSWEDHEVASFVLGLYTFGKNFTQVKKFMENKNTGEVMLFYYGKFYKSASYQSWSDSRKKGRRRKCVYGRKLYSGWRQQQLLSRLIPSVSDESQKQTLVNVSKSFAEGNITLEKYISSVKDLVGLRLLVDAVGIGKGKDDLTVVTSGPVKSPKPWFTVSPKSSSAPGLEAYTSLTSADIINQLTGSSRLSKARCSDIFWEAVWPRLLARGWRSEQPKERCYFTSKDNIVFIVPGVKEFSRGELVKGEDYFDSVSDILTKVALEPELLEFEAEANELAVAENSSDQSEEESSPSDKQRHRYLKSPCSNRGDLQMKFAVVDTSLVAGGKLCDSRNLNAEPLVCSEPKTRLGDKLDSKNVEMPLEAKKQVDDPMLFTVTDSNIKEKEESLEKVKDASKRLIKHRSNRQAETDDRSVSLAPSLKRRRLSACMRSEKIISRENSVFKHLRGDETKSTVCPESDHLGLCAVQQQNGASEDMNKDKERYQYKKTGTGPSSALVEIQEMSEINGLMSDSDKKGGTNDLKQEQAVELTSISGSNISPSNVLGTTQELGPAEQQQQDQQTNTDAPRRQSTRKRPLTTRALEALESSYLTTKGMKSTVKPRKRERSTKRNRTAKACNRAQHLLDSGSSVGLEKRGVDESKATASKPLDEIENSKPSLPLNGVTRQDSKPVLTERPKLPPIVLKLSLKRSRGASETQV